MIIRILLFLILVGMVWYALRYFMTTSPKKLAQLIKNLFFGFAGLLIVYLALTGRLNWLFALVGVVVAFMVRMLPLLIRYVPFLHRLWHQYTATKQHESPGSNKSDMSIQEAYEVLGLKPDASQQEIIAAHRKLMQKIHPDRGGSDYLAAKINRAKKILLKK